MNNPIVHFEILGADGPSLMQFYCGPGPLGGAVPLVALLSFAATITIWVGVHPSEEADVPIPPKANVSDIRRAAAVRTLHR
ncbi:MAG: hypothetical protein ABJA34_13450 [Pseudonocardiales bacterium]